MSKALKIFFVGLFAINIALSFCSFVWRAHGNSIADNIPLYVDYLWMIVVGLVVLTALAVKILRHRPDLSDSTKVIALNPNKRR